MTRSALLALVAFGLAAVPASAQDDPAATPDDTVGTTETVIEADPERARELYNAGRESLTARDFEAALSAFDEALVYNDTYAAAALGRGQALAQLGRLEDARSAFEQAAALASASDASNAGQIERVATTGAQQITDALAARAAAEAAAAQQSQAAAGAQANAQKIEQAGQMLAGAEIDMATATDAFALLEQARLDGFDVAPYAIYYAKALNAMERGAEAVPYAESALEQADPAADNSAIYIQLGLAHMSAGNTADARAAFEAITEGQGWHGWAQHYLGQLDA